jgi:hypothetical protein
MKGDRRGMSHCGNWMEGDIFIQSCFHYQVDGVELEKCISLIGFERDSGDSVTGYEST